MRAFVSSEMNSAADQARRDAVIGAVPVLGHEPVFLEGTPARPYYPDPDGVWLEVFWPARQRRRPDA